MKFYDNSPLARSNRPLPHEIEQFAKSVEFSLSYTETWENDETFVRVLNWLKEISK